MQIERWHGGRFIQNLQEIAFCTHWTTCQIDRWHGGTFIQNLQGITIHTHDYDRKDCLYGQAGGVVAYFPKFAGDCQAIRQQDSRQHIRLPYRQVGGMVADFPKLARHCNPHIRQYHIRLPKRQVGGMVAYFQILQGTAIHTYGNMIGHTATLNGQIGGMVAGFSKTCRRQQSTHKAT